MTEDQEEQFIVWRRYRDFQKIGMKESFLILYNGWLIMDYVLTHAPRKNISNFFLTDDFLENQK